MHVYVTAAAMEVLGQESIDDWPESVPENAWIEASVDHLEQEQERILMKVIDNFTNIRFNSQQTGVF